MLEGCIRQRPLQTPIEHVASKAHRCQVFVKTFKGQCLKCDEDNSSAGILGFFFLQLCFNGICLYFKHMFNNMIQNIFSKVHHLGTTGSDWAMAFTPRSICRSLEPSTKASCSSVQLRPRDGRDILPKQTQHIRTCLNTFLWEHFKYFVAGASNIFATTRLTEGKASKSSGPNPFVDPNSKTKLRAWSDGLQPSSDGLRPTI